MENGEWEMANFSQITDHTSLTTDHTSNLPNL